MADLDFGIFQVKESEGEVQVRLQKGVFVLPVSCTGYFFHPVQVEQSVLEKGVIYATYRGLERPYLFLAAFKHWTELVRAFMILLDITEPAAGVVGSAKIIPVSPTPGIELMLHATEHGYDAVRLLLYHYGQQVVDKQELRRIDNLWKREG